MSSGLDLFLLRRIKMLAQKTRAPCTGCAPPRRPAGYCSPLPATAASDAAGAAISISIARPARGTNHLSRRVGDHGR